MIFHEPMEHFAFTIAEALEAAARALKSQSQEIRDLHRLVSALDTRLDRLEAGGKEYDPNAVAESRHGEPK